MARHIPRIYCPDLCGDSFEVPEFQRNHLVSVLRLKEGSQFLAFNKSDGEWFCEVVEIRKSSIKAKKLELKREYEYKPKLA